MNRILLSLILITTCSPYTSAQIENKAPTKSKKPTGKQVEKQASVTIAGKQVNYTVKAAELDNVPNLSQKRKELFAC